MSTIRELRGLQKECKFPYLGSFTPKEQYQCRVHDFPGEGGGLNLLFGKFFSHKLHENEKKGLR